MRCRSCKSEIKNPFLSLGKTPLSNSYLKKEDLNKPELEFPLETFVCPQCFLVQVDDFEQPENIFNEDYAYFSSYSDSWLKHCEEYASEMTTRLGLGAKSLVMEIASNDGYLLQYFKARGIPVLGIEPTKNTALVAQQKGIPTETIFFNTETALQLAKSQRSADLLLGNNVLAHVPQLNDFVSALKLALKPNGTLTMEFPHLEKMIEGLQFDTIYHEHFCYFSLFAVKNIFFKHGLTVYDVQELSTHGGSLRVFARHNENNALPVQTCVESIVQREIKKGFTSVEFFNDFPKKVERVKSDLLSFLKTAKSEGKKVVGYGAPAKGNTLLNYCKVGADLISYTVDKNIHKQGKFLPGSRIPIFSPDKIREEKPPYVLILPWNIKDEVMSQMSTIKSWGGKFVIPLPNVEII
ncbi:MAG: class I SAM-dependent methyltransferase [Pseudomonadota bacterium]|nr:class I SAM-dependent methyltransferase [Pseudomonadota bacterium]